MESSLRIVFRGEVIEGFDAEEVKLSAKSRLNASASQVEQLFSGRPAILKKGLNAASGARYLALLAHFGMRASLEVAHTQARAADRPSPPPPAEQPAAESFDPERTQLIDSADLARYIKDVQRHMPEPSPAPTLPEPAPAPVAVPPSRDEAIPRPVLAQHTGAEQTFAPRAAQQIDSASVADPMTVFFQEETPGLPKPSSTPPKPATSWPERMLLALLIGGISYTLYWAVTRY